MSDQTPITDTDTLIQKLLSVRLTSYELGFLRGLQTHSPTPTQQAGLAKIQKRYAHVWANNREPNETSPRTT